VALLIATSVERDDRLVSPADERTFTRQELYTLLNCDTIRTIEMRNDWIARFALSSPMTIRETERA